jgi:serine/threonine-protein kinase
MLTGEVPFGGRNVVEVLSKHTHEAPVPPRARRPDLPIPLALEQLVLRALRKDPAERFASASAMRQALETLPLDATDRRGPRRWWRWAVAGLLLVGLLAATALLQRQPSPPPGSSLAPTPIDRPAPPSKAAPPPQPAPVVEQTTATVEPTTAPVETTPAPLRSASPATPRRPLERGTHRPGRAPRTGRPAKHRPGARPAPRRGELEDNPFR